MTIPIVFAGAGDPIEIGLAWISTERNFANIALQLLWAKGFI
jgi:hypothetical protein